MSYTETKYFNSPWGILVEYDVTTLRQFLLCQVWLHRDEETTVDLAEIHEILASAGNYFPMHEKE